MKLTVHALAKRKKVIAQSKEEEGGSYGGPFVDDDRDEDGKLLLTWHCNDGNMITMTLNNDEAKAVITAIVDKL